MTLINRDAIRMLMEDIGPDKEEFEEIHRCSECDGEWNSWLDVTDGHLVVIGEGEDKPWTIAVGCEGYYQLGKRFE